MENKIYVTKFECPGCEIGTRFFKIHKDLLPVHLSKDDSFYCPEGKNFPIFSEEDMKSSPVFKEQNEAPSFEDVEFLENKKKIQLEKFMVDVETESSVDNIQKRFDSLIRTIKQLRLAEDALIIYRLTRKVEEIKKTHGI